MDKNKLIIFGVIGGIIIVVVLFIVGFLLGDKGESPYNVQATLKFWGINEPYAYQGVFEQFKEVYPNVSITYRGFDSILDYEQTLLDALAAGTGPDIFMVRNNDLARKANKIFPVPGSKYSLLRLRNDFPQVVEQSFAPQGGIYALPTSIDTLVLLYNRTALNEAAVVFPPETWEEVQEVVPKLIIYDDMGAVTRAAIALGGSRNVNHAKDILSLLMLQGGAELVNDEYTAATFASQEGVEALTFYTQFANPNSKVFTWDAGQLHSIEAFSQGKAAMIVDYAATLSKVRERSPFLDIGIAPVPQPEGGDSISYAHYWGYTVSRQSSYLTVAWDFILFLTTDEQNTSLYLENTGSPPALLRLVNRYLKDPELSVFAHQVLTSRSWIEPDPERVSTIFDDIIEAVVKNGEKPLDALRSGEKKVTQLMERRF